LSLLKNLVVESEVPSMAERSIAPTVTAPSEAVFTVPAETYVPLAFVNEVTPESTIDQTLSLLKNLVLVSTPSIAERSTVPTVTAPVAAVLAVVAETYVPFAFVKESTLASEVTVTTFPVEDN